MGAGSLPARPLGEGKVDDSAVGGEGLIWLTLSDGGGLGGESEASLRLFLFEPSPPESEPRGCITARLRGFATMGATARCLVLERARRDGVLTLRRKRNRDDVRPCFPFDEQEGKIGEQSNAELLTRGAKRTSLLGSVEGRGQGTQRLPKLGHCL